MKFELLEKKLRDFETSADQRVMSGVYIVVRLDGRGFTKLTKELLVLERPFDATFRDAMIETVKHLMNCGFKIVYGYTQSDEISLLFDINENAFNRKTRKLISILAGEASARFTQAIGTLASFDCRIIPLPGVDLVTDYFRWRAEDASRNALNAWCYWTLRNEGFTVRGATMHLEGKSTAEKNEILFQRGINYNDVPAWQKRGVCFYYVLSGKAGIDCRVNSEIITFKNRLMVQDDLPRGESYELLIKGILNKELELK